MKQNQILMIHGSEYKQMTMRLLEAADLAGQIGDPAKRIALKPNLVLASTPELGAVTHPEIVAGVLEYLQTHGFRNLRVMEGSWVGAKTMPAARESGLLSVCEEYAVPFVDLQADSSISVDGKGMSIKICNQAQETDFLINLPVLKGHCQTMLTCALKNLKGLLPNSEKRRFHTLGLHKPIAHLNAAIRQDFIVVDNICGDLDFEEGGTPVSMDRIFCCLDPVLCDAFACETLGLQTQDVPYIALAESLGIGCADVERAELIPLNGGTVAPEQRRSGRIRELAAYTEPIDACSACYGMLIHALDKLERQGTLRGHRQKICIGQGYRGQTGQIGVGSCTSGCACHLNGCPPTAKDILAFLEKNWR
ncbi:MAG: DUF362 domain-containing protein [Oscillospiraceae bacterium]|nr:DUF362 domain-containing protein [Oscillospiraceae bacterium]